MQNNAAAAGERFRVCEGLPASAQVDGVRLLAQELKMALRKLARACERRRAASGKGVTHSADRPLAPAPNHFRPTEITGQTPSFVISCAQVARGVRQAHWLAAPPGSHNREESLKSHESALYQSGQDAGT